MPLHVYIPSDLDAELNRLVEAIEPRTTKTAIVVAALRAYMRSRRRQEELPDD